MRIVLVITGLGVGGAERLVTGLADRYVAQGHEVLVVRLQGEAELRPRDSRVRMENLGMRRSPLGVVAALWRFRCLLRAFRPDVVNSHLVHANIFTRILRLFTPIPRLISSAHNTNEGGRVRMLAYRATDRLADISTNVSEEAAAAFENRKAVKPGRMVVILNGIDTKKFTFDKASRGRLRKEVGVDGGTPLILAVGRLSEQKDYPNLLRAFSRLEECPALPHLAIAGTGPLLDDLLKLVKSLGVTDRISFLGLRHDVPGLMAACDVFVLPSAWEGFGLVVAEAMACSRPVVATDCGGVREVVGDAGFLVTPRDADALSKAVGRALRLPDDDRDRLGGAARERVIAHYSFETMADKYLSLYRGAAGVFKDVR